MSERLSYRDAGIDLDAAERAKERLKELVGSTRDRFTLSELGHFGGLYRVPDSVADPVLVSSADGVGTKLKLAFATGRHDTVGQCLVNHCVNDILVQGARPLFFLDYLATGEMDERVVHEVVRGVAIGCKANGCALLGGETAQMPDFYAPEEYDLAGFIVGVVTRAGIVDGSAIRAGDALVGVASSGLHTNGVRTVVRPRVADSIRSSDRPTIALCIVRSHGLPHGLPSGKSVNKNRGTPQYSTISRQQPRMTVAIPFFSSSLATRLTV